MDLQDWTVVSAELLQEIFGQLDAEEKGKLYDVYVHLRRDSARFFADLPEIRGSVYPKRFARVRIAATRELIGCLARRDDVRAISLVEQLHPCMDQAAQMCALHEFKLSRSKTGAGVMIAIIDSGIDAAHPMFDDRIEFIWDQTVVGTHSSEVPSGRYYTRSALNASKDFTGHGTHIAGIAAGHDPEYGGVAHGARLAIIKSTLKEPDIVQALNWLKNYTVNLRIPVVVNLSMEAFNDPRDGSGALCETIDDLSGPGFIVCCASGNTGRDACHAEVKLESGHSSSVGFRVVDGEELRSKVVIKGWADPDTLIECEFRDSQGNAWQPHVQKTAPSNRLVGAGVTLSYIYPKNDPAFDDATSFLLTLQETAPGSLTANWDMRITNKGNQSASVHLWGAPSGSVVFHEKSATNRFKIAAPGAALRAVTVGAMVSKTTWEDESGDMHYDKNKRRFQVASFSSPGPLRSGRGKPDVVAPGVYICSARASSAKFEPLCSISPRIALMAGSSMATPFIAGVVALMLEDSPTLGPEEVKSRLKAACAIPSRRVGEFDEFWGHGFPELLLL